MRVKEITFVEKWDFFSGMRDFLNEHKDTFFFSSTTTYAVASASAFLLRPGLYTCPYKRPSRVWAWEGGWRAWEGGG